MATEDGVLQYRVSCSQEPVTDIWPLLDEELQIFNTQITKVRDPLEMQILVPPVWGKT